MKLNRDFKEGDNLINLSPEQIDSLQELGNIGSGNAVVALSELVNKRVEEKIGLLKSYLPNFLVENKNLYSILSKGIHSLDEQECLMYFPIMKIGIQLMLDEKIEQMQKDETLKIAKEEIQNITNKLKTN